MNDAGNCCYTTYMDQNTALIPVYVEKDPFFLRGEDESNGYRDNLDPPFSISSLPQDEEPSTVSLFSVDLHLLLSKEYFLTEPPVTIGKSVEVLRVLSFFRSNTPSVACRDLLEGKKGITLGQNIHSHQQRD